MKIVETVDFNFFLYERRYLGVETFLQFSYSDTKLSITFCITFYARRQPQKQYLNFYYAHCKNRLNF